MSYVSKNPRFNSQILTDQGTNSVDDPASGSHKVVNRNGLLYMRDSSGNETSIGSAGSTGGINYIDNPSAETGTDGWATYADAAGTTPVDGTGGSANVTLTRTTTAGEILRGDASFELTVPANSQGEGFSYDFTIDKADQNKVLGIWFDVDATDANYVDDDLQVFIYDKDQSQLITPTSPINGYKIKGNQYRNRIAFAPYNTSSNDYRLIIHVAADNASGYSVRFDNFEVGPGAIMTGFDGIWKRYTESDVTFSSTPAGWSSPTAELIPYKTTDGIWRLRFTVQATTNSLSTRDFKIDGITTSGGYQACSHSGDATGGYCQLDPASTFVTRSSLSLSFVRVSGDVELASKPTWADFDPIATIFPSTEDLALSGWQSYTPTVSGMTLTASEMQWRRIGSSVEIQGSIDLATSSASEAQISLPNGYTVSYFSQNVVANFVGWYARDSTANGNLGPMLATNGDTYLNFARHDISTAYPSLSPANSDVLFSGANSVSIFASVPVAEFADLGQVPPIGVEIAANGNPGLLPYYNTTTQSADNDFTGGSFKITRIGNVVTITSDGLTHANASSASTSSGFLPTWARPNATTYFVNLIGTVTQQRMAVNTSGIITVAYFNTSFTGLNATSADNGSITYVVN